MLVLSRKEGQRILIGSEIEIVVTEIHGNRVQIGVQAPSEVPIHREEVRWRVQLENVKPPSPPIVEAAV